FASLPSRVARAPVPRMGRVVMQKGAGVCSDAAVRGGVERAVELKVAEEVLGRAGAAFEKVFAVLESQVVAIDVLQVALSLEALRIGGRRTYVDGARFTVKCSSGACVGVGA